MILVLLACLPEDVALDELVEKTNGFSGAEVTALCREALLEVVAESIAKGESAEEMKAVLTRRHFEKALTVVRKRTTTKS